MRVVAIGLWVPARHGGVLFTIVGTGPARLGTAQVAIGLCPDSDSVSVSVARDLIQEPLVSIN